MTQFLSFFKGLIRPTTLLSLAVPAKLSSSVRISLGRLPMTHQSAIEKVEALLTALVAYSNNVKCQNLIGQTSHDTSERH